MDEIEVMLHDEDIDILCVCETWLDSNIGNNFINIPHFSITRYDTGRGGGSCIIVRDSLSVTAININLDKVEGVDDVWLQIQCKKYPSFIVGCIYRHPKAKVPSFSYLSEIFKYMCLKNKPVFILGDFNDNVLHGGSNMKKIIRNLSLTQIIDQPTRITAFSSTLLDLVITNKADMIVESKVTPSTIADHEMISLVINVHKPKPTPLTITYRCKKNYNVNIFCNSLLNETHTFNSILSTDNVNTQVQIFTDTFNTCLNECAPLVTREIRRPFAPWIDEQLRSLINEKNELQINLKNDRSNQILSEQFKQLKKNIQIQIKNAKTVYYRNEFEKCKGNSGATWGVVQNMISYLKNKGNNPGYSDTSAKAKEFNEYFAKVGEIAFQKSQEGLRNDAPSYNVDVNASSNILQLFRPQPVTIDTLILVIKDLKETKSFGCDGILLQFIRDALPVIAFYVTVIINTSIVTGIYPELWKHPYVVPVYKSGDVENINNYRPISLLPILSKVLEKIVANQLMSFLESHKLLSSSQHGFRGNLSTETALMKVNKRIYEAIDNQKISLLLLLDLSKAFDSVSHDILLRKCSNLQIDHFWFKDYLSQRVQSVKVNSVISPPIKINYGVPQGSILGPLLFLIYINDMAEVLRNYFLIQYADDTQFILTGEPSDLNSLISEGENALIEAKQYFQLNGLNVNELKTQCIFIGSRQYISLIPPDLTIQFGNTAIIPSKSVKNLGVYMDQYLLYDVHIDHISRKINGILMFLNRIKDRFDKAGRIIVIQSLVLSIITYCSKVWGNTTSEQLERVQKLENFAAKVALGKGRKYDHATPFLRELGWLKIKSKFTYDICVFTYKITNKMLPDWLFTFPNVSNIIARNTRQSNDLFVPRTRTDLGARAITVKGPQTWNILPDFIKKAHTLKTFQNKLKRYLLEEEF